MGWVQRMIHIGYKKMFIATSVALEAWHKMARMWSQLKLYLYFVCLHEWVSERSYIHVVVDSNGRNYALLNVVRESYLTQIVFSSSKESKNNTWLWVLNLTCSATMVCSRCGSRRCIISWNDGPGTSDNKPSRLSCNYDVAETTQAYENSYMVWMWQPVAPSIFAKCWF